MLDSTPRLHANRLFGQLGHGHACPGIFILKTTITLCCFFLSSFLLLAQKYHTTIYDRSNGLSHNSILSLDHDVHGDLWIATLGGINKLVDGSFETVQIDKSALLFSTILVDQNQVLWAMRKQQNPDSSPFEQSFVLFDIRSQSKIDIKEYVDDDPIFKQEVVIHKVWRDQRRNILFDTDRGLYRFQNHTMTLIDSGRRQGIYSILSQDTSFVVRLKPNQAEIKNLSNGEVTYHPRLHGSMDVKVTAGSIDFEVQVVADSSGNLSNVQIHEINYPEKVLRVTKPAQFHLGRNPYYIDDSTTLIAAKPHVFLIHHNDNKLSIETIFNETFPLKGGVLYVCLRNGKSIWMGTSDGLIEVEPQELTYEHYFQNEGISTRELISAGPDTVLVTSYAGLKAIFLNEKKGISFPAIRVSTKIEHIENGKYLIGESGSLIEWDIHYPDTFRILWNEDLPFNFSDLLKIDDHTIWAATSQGILEFDLDNQSFEFLDFENEDFEHDIYGLYKIDSSPGTIWMAGNERVIEYNRKTNKIHPIRELDGFSISFVYEDRSEKHIFWLGTIEQGLIKFHHRDGVQLQLTMFDGLANNSIHSVYEDNFDRLWMSSNLGISTYSKVTGEVQNYFTDFNEPVSEFNFQSSLKLSDGGLMFGSVNGVIRIDPNQFIYHSDSQSEYPREEITILMNSKDGELISSVKLPRTRESKVNVPNLHHSITIQVPELLNSSGSRLRYMLSSSEKSWTYANHSKFELDRLPPGRHILLISKKLGIHLWSEGKIVTLNVALPWFKKPWFLGGILAFLTLGIFGYSFLNNRRLRRINARIEKQVLEQTQKIREQNNELNELIQENELIFQIIGHDLRSPVLSMTQVSDNIRYVLKEKSDPVLEKLSNSISSRSNSILHMLDDILAWGRMKKTDRVFANRHSDLNDIAQSVASELRESSMRKGQEVVIITSQSVNTDRDPKIVHIVVRNVLSNAIKFSDQGSKIIVEIENKIYPTITITDQGKGIPDKIIRNLGKIETTESQKGTAGELGLGLGLTISKLLMKHLKGMIHFHTVQGKGTSVELVFPFYPKN